VPRLKPCQVGRRRRRPRLRSGKTWQPSPSRLARRRTCPSRGRWRSALGHEAVRRCWNRSSRPGRCCGGGGRRERMREIECA
jgi:hypothetical protein